ncbi:hypothetical protein CTT39_23850 [Agrobacterium rosae]|nr:hypothetical protein CTT39_23850 [Agrobacterium rosae]
MIDMIFLLERVVIGNGVNTKHGKGQENEAQIELLPNDPTSQQFESDSIWFDADLAATILCAEQRPRVPVIWE